MSRLSAITGIFATLLLLLPACSKDPKDLPGAEKLAWLVPAEAQFVVSSDNLAALKKSLETAPRLKAVTSTDLFNDLLMLPTFSSIRQAAFSVAGATKSQVGDVFVDGMLEGAAVLALKDQPEGSSSYLLIKPLDTSQKAVTSALALWARGGEGATASDVDGTSTFTLPQGSSAVFWAELQGTLFLSNDAGFLTNAVKLAKKTLEEGKSLGGDDDFPPLKGPLTAVVNASAYRQAFPSKGDLLGVVGLKAARISLNPEDGKMGLEWVPDPAWGSLEKGSLDNSRYVPRDALFYASISDLKPQALIDNLSATWDDKTQQKLGISLLQSIKSELQGEAFVSLHGLSSEGPPQLHQVVGFKVSSPDKLKEPLFLLWKTLFMNPPEESVLVDLEQARLVCPSGEAAPLCYALHQSYLLIGDDTSLRDSLAAAAGKAPGLSDRKGLEGALKPGSEYVMAVAFDLEAIHQALLAHLLSLTDETYKKEDVEAVVGPFLESLAAFKGYGGTLALERGHAVGALEAL